MPAYPDFIDQAQFDKYTADWLVLINDGSTEDLQQAFEAPDDARTNFLTFSIDQIVALVLAPNAHLIKARFLRMPDAAGQPRFSATLFAVDAADHLLTAYYIPTQAAATTTQAVSPSPEPSTKIPHAVALGWLTDWVNAGSLTTAMFTTTHGPLHGYNFGVGTFQDPLVGEEPYEEKSLFLNCGLNAGMAQLVVYVGLTGSRTQGSVAGVPTGDIFYDMGTPCPPAP